MYKYRIIIFLLIVNTGLSIMSLFNGNDIAKKEDEGIKQEVIADNPPPKYQLEEVTEF